MSFITDVGAAWTILGTIIVMIAIPCIATEHADAKFVFTAFKTEVPKSLGIDSGL